MSSRPASSWQIRRRAALAFQNRERGLPPQLRGAEPGETQLSVHEIVYGVEIGVFRTPNLYVVLAQKGAAA